MESLCDVLDDQESIRQLKLKFRKTKVTSQGFDLVLDMISSMPTLENLSLDFSDCVIGNIDTKFLRLVLRNDQLKLMTLNLSNAHLSVETIHELVELMLEQFKTKGRMRMNLQL